MALRRSSPLTGFPFPTPGCGPTSCPHLLPLRRPPRQLPALWRRSLCGPDGLATPSPGPRSSCGPSRPTSSPALAAGAPAASWPSLRYSTAQAILEHLRLPSRPLPLAPGHLPAPARPLVGAVRGSRLAPARPRPWDCSTLSSGEHHAARLRARSLAPQGEEEQTGEPVRGPGRARPGSEGKHRQRWPRDVAGARWRDPGADGLNPRATGEGSNQREARGLTPPAKAGAGPGQRAEGPVARAGPCSAGLPRRRGAK
jgi:hypothetical protein